MQKILLLFLLTGFLSSCSCSRKDEPEKSAKTEVEEIDTLGVFVEQIHQCSNLYTAEVELHKVVVKEDPIKVEGKVFGNEINIEIPLGEKKIAIPLSATAKACIDFSEFSKKNVVIDGDDIIIELPKPKVVLSSTSVDHDNVRKEVSFFRGDFTDEEIASFQKQGRNEMIKVIPNSGLLQKAEAGAATVIVPMLMELGYKDKNIQVRFSRDVLSDPVAFIKKELGVK